MKVKQGSEGKYLKETQYGTKLIVIMYKFTKPELREGTFFLGGGLGNFGIFFQTSVNPSLHFNKKTPLGD